MLHNIIILSKFKLSHFLEHYQNISKLDTFRFPTRKHQIPKHQKSLRNGRPSPKPGPWGGSRLLAAATAMKPSSPVHWLKQRRRIFWSHVFPCPFCGLFQVPSVGFAGVYDLYVLRWYLDFIPVGEKHHVFFPAHCSYCFAWFVHHRLLGQLLLQRALPSAKAYSAPQMSVKPSESKKWQLVRICGNGTYALTETGVHRCLQQWQKMNIKFWRKCLGRSPHRLSIHEPFEHWRYSSQLVNPTSPALPLGRPQHCPYPVKAMKNLLAWTCLIRKLNKKNTSSSAHRLIASHPHLILQFSDTRVLLWDSVLPSHRHPRCPRRAPRWVAWGVARRAAAHAAPCTGGHLRCDVTGHNVTVFQSHKWDGNICEKNL